MIWYGADVYETAWVNDRLQAAAKIPLLISADLEAGVGMRFDNTTFWPWAMAVAATGEPSYAERQGRIVAREAKLLGINQIYAPVADVNNNPDNPVINVRSYGEDPGEVARYVSAFIRGVQSEDVIATVKHFPGHGDTQTDSHRSLPILEVSRERLDQVELVPFRAAVEEGVLSVMLAHLAIPSIDAAPFVGKGSGAPNPYTDDELIEPFGDATTPSSLSRRLVDGLLRSELGFEGLVVTDALALEPGTSGHELGLAAPHVLLRMAEVVDGEVEILVELSPRLEYGLVRPQLVREPAGLRTVGGPDTLLLSGDRELEAQGGQAAGQFVLGRGQSAAFALHHAQGTRADAPRSL
ncbi:MAG: hypothetical protein KY432_05400, partial [Acidobacteria bacterium]|nr:hypothetical protein [Acidobacteriota bacterium]